MEMKMWLVILTALIPLIVGSIYYNPKVVGGIWMKETGMTEEKAKQANMLKVFGLTYIFSIMISFVVMQSVIHQMGVFGVFQGTDFETPGTEAHKLYHDVMGNYGHSYRSFKHGFLHGIMLSLFLVWPVVSINAMFEQRGWKYVAIHVGYWTICLALIGGVLCAFV